MAELFPYQVVSFLDAEPKINESAYNSSRGWFPQITLKRRFNLETESEEELISRLSSFASSTGKLSVKLGGLVKPDRMPVRVIEVKNRDDLLNFHLALIEALGGDLVSRYPERDGYNYLPHVTAEYDNRFVIDVDEYKDRDYLLGKICLLKDGTGDDSLAIHYFDLSSNTE